MFPGEHVAKEGISWEAHFQDLLQGLFLSILIKTPQFEKPIFYDWEHPNFDPTSKPFFKQFDEKGNFINPSKPEESEEFDTSSYFSSSIKVIYDFLGKRKSDTTNEVIYFNPNSLISIVAFFQSEL